MYGSRSSLSIYSHTRTKRVFVLMNYLCFIRRVWNNRWWRRSGFFLINFSPQNSGSDSHRCGDRVLRIFIGKPVDKKSVRFQRQSGFARIYRYSHALCLWHTFTILIQFTNTACHSSAFHCQLLPLPALGEHTIILLLELYVLKCHKVYIFIRGYVSAY